MPANILAQDGYKVTPANFPKADVRRFMRLTRRGMSFDEAAAIVMADWREKWARGCVARVTGQLLSRRVSARLTLALVTDWARAEYGMAADAVRATVEWVAARERQRRRGGGQRAS